LGCQLHGEGSNSAQGLSFLTWAVPDASVTKGNGSWPQASMLEVQLFLQKLRVVRSSCMLRQYWKNMCEGVE
jgi:hypothetical protein